MTDTEPTLREKPEPRCHECGSTCHKPIFVEQRQEFTSDWEYGHASRIQTRTVKAGVYCTWGCLATVAAIEGGHE